MNLRELIIERIMWAVTDETLLREFSVTEEGLHDLSDLDLLDLYENLVFDTSA